MMKYTEEQKENAIALAQEIGIMKASKELHISDQTIRAWRFQAAQKEEEQWDDQNNSENGSLLIDEEPPVEKIETIDPEQIEGVISPDSSDTSNMNAPIHNDHQESPTHQIPNNMPELSYLQMENEELKIRITILKKTLLGIVEAITAV